MVVYCVSVLVKDGFTEDFRKAVKVNARETIKEMGNLRFDVLQSDEDPREFMLYEVYRSEEAVKAHKETRHYKEWRDTVEPWMAQPRRGRRFTPVHPTDEEKWSS